MMNDDLTNKVKRQSSESSEALTEDGNKIFHELKDDENTKEDEGANLKAILPVFVHPPSKPVFVTRNVRLPIDTNTSSGLVSKNKKPGYLNPYTRLQERYESERILNDEISRTSFPPPTHIPTHKSTHTFNSWTRRRSKCKCKCTFSDAIVLGLILVVLVPVIYSILFAKQHWIRNYAYLATFSNVVLIVNIVMFVVEIWFNPKTGPEDIFFIEPRILAKIGGMSVREILCKHEYFRVLVSMVLHTDMIHLCMNSYGLLHSTGLFERKFGLFCTAAIYILSHISAVVICLPHMELSLVSVGASCAIYGVEGARIAELLFNIRRHGRKKVENYIKDFAFMFVFNAVYLFLRSQSASNLHHLAGLITGFIFGIVLFQKSLAYKLLGSLLLIFVLYRSVVLCYKRAKKIRFL